MTIITVGEAEIHLFKVIKQTAAGQEIVIAKAGKPVVRLVPLTEPEQRPRVLGSGRGRIKVPQNFNVLHADTIQHMFAGCPSFGGAGLPVHQ